MDKEVTSPIFFRLKAAAKTEEDLFNESGSISGDFAKIELPEGLEIIKDPHDMNSHKLYFSGDAPIVVNTRESDDLHPWTIVYYKEGKSGFTNPWNGFETQIWQEDEGEPSL